MIQITSTKSLFIQTKGQNFNFREKESVPIGFIVENVLPVHINVHIIHVNHYKLPNYLFKPLQIVMIVYDN